MASVSTIPVSLAAGPLLLQNLGPDDLYVGHSYADGTPTVTPSTGFRLSTGESISVQSTSTKISVVSVGTSEVRYLSAGTGVYAAVVEAAPAV